MQYFPLSDLITRLDQTMDLSEESDNTGFITRLEKINYLNEGVDEAEAVIHTLGREARYFLASQPLNLSDGQQAYGLPTDIYGNKIVRVMYHNGTEIYEMKRMRRRNGMSVEEQIAYINQFGSNDPYQYIVKNDSASFGNEIWLYPEARETSEDRATIWYIRNANSLAVNDDVCDIPEFADFVVQFARVRCFRKEFHGNVPPLELEILKDKKQLMVDTLTNMVVDENSELEQDWSHYDEHS